MDHKHHNGQGHHADEPVEQEAMDKAVHGRAVDSEVHGQDGHQEHNAHAPDRVTAAGGLPGAHAAHRQMSDPATGQSHTSHEGMRHAAAGDQGHAGGHVDHTGHELGA